MILNLSWYFFAFGAIQVQSMVKIQVSLNVYAVYKLKNRCPETSPFEYKITLFKKVNVKYTLSSLLKTNKTQKKEREIKMLLNA